MSRDCAPTLSKNTVNSGSRFPVEVVDIQAGDQLINRTVNVKVAGNNNNNNTNE